jgi:hypothetical protein
VIYCLRCVSSLHWPHILQILVPTFSAFSVAQGYVSSDPNQKRHVEDFDHSVEEAELDEMGDEAAERRRRIEEERQGRSCPICLSKPVAARMTKCGHVSQPSAPMKICAYRQIFCFPCILHFIQLSDIPKSARCPICGDTIHEGMLKSVKYLDADAMLQASHGHHDDDDGPDPSASAGPSQVRDDNHHIGMVGEMEGFEGESTKAGTEVETETIPDTAHRIHMRLVQRNQMTTLALPNSSTWPSDAIPPHSAPWYFLPDILSYSRFMLASPEYMLSELRRELKELEHEWEMMKGDALGRDFVRAARDKVERQVGKVANELMTDMVRREERKARDGWIEAVGGEMREKARRKDRERRQREREEATKQAAEQADAPHGLLATQDQSFDPRNPNVQIPPNLTVEPNPMPAPKRNRRRGNNAQPATGQIAPSPSYFFYQSSLGANVFLNPLDIRILLAHFKSYSLFPSTISFTSSGFDTATINDELRKRCKYLSHLPAGTEVVFVEADLEEIVGSIGLHAFEQPLKARRSKRRDRTKREDKAKSRWEKSERDKLPLPMEDREFAQALQRSHVESLPTWTDPPLSTSANSSHGVHPAASPSTSPSLAVWGSYQQPRATFANALGHTTSSALRSQRDNLENEAEVNAAWEAFEQLDLQPKTTPVEGDAAASGGAGAGGGQKKGGKKGGKKQVLVLGGGSRRGA